MSDDTQPATATRILRRVVVFGAGALGSLLGGRLSLRLPVVLIARGAHLVAMRERGLWLGGLADLHCPAGGNLTALGRLEELSSPLQAGELILLTVKALQVKDAGVALAEILRRTGTPRVVVLALQNGTGFEDDLRTALHDLADVRFGVAFAGATTKEPGVVEDWGGEVFVPTGMLFEKLVAEWIAAGQPASAVADVEVRRWRKILLNCFLNAFSALLDTRNCETIRPEWRPLRRAILRECRSVAAAHGVEMPHEDELLEGFEQRSLSSRNVNSMLQDIRRGRPTEIEFLNGAMVRLTGRDSDQAPANAAIAEWVRRLEKTPPERLERLRRQAVTDLLARSWSDI